MVNGQPIKKHLLQNEDVIDIGKYKLRFQADAATVGDSTAPQIPSTTTFADPVPCAKIRVLNGPNAGRDLLLTKPVTTIGSPGVQVVVIARQDQVYFIAHVEGASKPKLNNVEIDAKPQQITNGDVINLSGTSMKFQWSSDALI
ncbi:MAG: hypothetical protein NVS3B3_20110 [Aquirhabdus sp.]